MRRSNAPRNPYRRTNRSRPLTGGARGANLSRVKRRRSTTRKASRSDASGDAELVRLARAALRRAHSPYSGVRVGAALRATDGTVFTGCNVENASYGLTLCAERVAVSKAVSEGATEFTTIAIASNKTPAAAKQGTKALMPCGACRQTLHEFAPNLRVLVAGPRGSVRATTLPKLLPHAFGPRDLR
ncbi:MAG: cytidine deaminase [Planctomycetes bacterium]|nr:cytidine deaminase [Planctomycetota bacterium]